MLSPPPLGLGATQLMSKELKGPPGSPVLLCSGTAMTSITAYWPFSVVPQVGHPDTLPQPLKMTNIVATTTVNRILVLIESSCDFPFGNGFEPPRKLRIWLNVCCPLLIILCQPTSERTDSRT